MDDMELANTGIRLGVDVGGTFTDIVGILPDGAVFSEKVLSSPDDYSVAIEAGVRAALNRNSMSAGKVMEFVHGATIATNAILTRSGARTALLTTKGFRDLLEIRRMRMPRLYDMHWQKPRPLVPRNLVLEVGERMDHKGVTCLALDEEGLRSSISQLIEQDVESIAVCFLHSYANPTHEQRTRDIILEMAPSIQVSISSEVLPEIKEYERASTTVINAYVQPLVARYIGSMERDLRKVGISQPVMIMQSNGGMMPSESALRFPFNIIESGPAAGVIGAYQLSKRLGIQDVLTLDIGGTTAKAAIIENGTISRSREYEVGSDLSIGHRLVRGTGYALRVPSIDIAEVGAGGGSIAWTDPGRALKLGPRSAGAKPGPACYGLGGTEPTTTDANVHLGLTNPEQLAGGRLRLDRDKAEEAIHNQLSRPLRISVTEAAWGIRIVANSNVARAVKAVSGARGRDPGSFCLFAFGGMGPVHALDLADELGIRKVMIPPMAGLFSALGLLFADVEHHFVRSVQFVSTNGDDHRLSHVADELVSQASSLLKQEGYHGDRQHLTLQADAQYRGQDSSLTIPWRSLKLDGKSLDALIRDFHSQHEATFGYMSAEEEVEITAVRCVAQGLPDVPRVPDRLRSFADETSYETGSRKCYFGPRNGWITTDIIGRQNLCGTVVKGPAIIEEDSSLTVVLPGWKASLDDWSNIVLDRL